jgi:hypothetical protein
MILGKRTSLIQAACAAFFIAFCLLSPAWAEETAEPDEDETESRPHYAAAAAEIFGSNLAINAFDRFALGKDYAQTDLSSIARNLSSSWVFDQDCFTVNEIGHPYHGSLYFTAARSNGLGFWESAAGTVLGSASWELFGETELPSINDIISTTMGGVVLGEIEHRLYAEAARTHSPLRFVASPMDALNDALRDRDEDGDPADASVSVSLEAGFAFPDLDMAESRGVASGRAEPLGFVAESLSYGDPFESGPSEPFSRFEQRLRIGNSSSFYEVSFFANGSLCSYPLVDTRSSKLALGSSLHYDFIFSSLVSLSANSVGLSLAGARKLGGGRNFSGQLHLNAVAMSTNENVFMMDGSDSSSKRDYDFGLGEGSKLYLLATGPGGKSLRLEYSFYGLHSIPAAADGDGANFDYATIGILEIAYERRAAERLALGLSYRLYHKDAFYSSLPDVHESIQAVTLYARIL